MEEEVNIKFEEFIVVTKNEVVYINLMFSFLYTDEMVKVVRKFKRKGWIYCLSVFLYYY